MANKKIRNLKGNKVYDPSAISNYQYNESAGAQKQVDVGPKLTGIPTATTPITVCNAAPVPLPSKGRSVAVYNNAGSMATITFGDANVTSQAIGVTQAGTTSSVGIPCPPNAWTHLSAGDATHLITSAATLFVFLIEDDSFIHVT